jgi:hypothetical protein
MRCWRLSPARPKRSLREGVARGYELIGPHLECGSIAILAMRSTNIAGLRNHLTRYLKKVRAGEEIVARDRQLPFAKITPLANPGGVEDWDSSLQD